MFLALHMSAFIYYKARMNFFLIHRLKNWDYLVTAYKFQHILCRYSPEKMTVKKGGGQTCIQDCLILK